MKFSIKDFFSKCDQIRCFLWIWSQLLKKSFIENFIFCTVCKLIIFLCSCSYSGCKIRIRQLSGRGRESVPFFYVCVVNQWSKQIKQFGRKKYLTQLVRGVIPPPLFWINPPFSKIPPFLEIQDVPTFHRSIGKTKVLKNSFNQFVYNFYPQSILILGECLQKW